MKLTLSLILVAAAALIAADVPLVQPAQVAAALKSANKPVVIHVGFGMLYRGKHIPGSVYAGPGNRADGVDALKKAVANVPHDREIVLYCGCCPWDKCPNIKPAFDTLHAMGYSKVRAMFVPTNFAKDWIEHGYPVELGSAAAQ